MAESLKEMIQKITKTDDGIYQASVVSPEPFEIRIANDDKNTVSPIISERVRNTEWHAGDGVYVLFIKGKYFILDRV